MIRWYLTNEILYNFLFLDLTNMCSYFHYIQNKYMTIFKLRFFPYSSHPLHILSVHMASCSSSYQFIWPPAAAVISSYGLLQQQYTDDTQLYVTISKDNYDTSVAKLELCLSFIYIPGSAITG